MPGYQLQPRHTPTIERGDQYLDRDVVDDLAWEREIHQVLERHRAQEPAVNPVTAAVLTALFERPDSG